jgi:hypothetical protein
MKQRRHPKSLCLMVLSLLGMGVMVKASDGPVQVRIDCAQVLDRRPVLWGHVNVSRRAPPPPELCELIVKEYGRPQVTRGWLLLDQMWDYRTDAHRFDYEISKDHYVGDTTKIRSATVGTPTGLRYYRYLDAISRNSETVLLNIRGYEPDVLSGLLTYDKWKEVFKSAVRHYKQRCPNLLYIEVLNEPSAKNQSNIRSIKNSYAFYRLAYQAINELNRELKPARPLRVGGCGGFRTADAIQIVKDYAADPASDKRLDFVSFHHYWAEDRPAQVADWEDQIDRVLRQEALPTNLPILVTEIGYAHQWKDKPAKNLWHACGMTAYQYYARRSPDLRLFPWVQYHSKEQIAFVQFDTELRMTPYGAAVKMFQMHREHEVTAQSDGLGDDGNGLGVLATLDDTGMTVHLWNLQPDGRTSVHADVAVSNVPEALLSRPLTVRRYLIDSKHSNCLTDANAAGGLERIETSEIKGSATISMTAELEPMGICLWKIDRMEVQP